MCSSAVNVHEKCLYTCMKHMCIMQVKVISHCMRRPPPAFITKQRRRSASIKEREMVSFMHCFPKEQLVDVNFLYRETHRSRESWDREQPWYRTASRSPALFCLCNQSIYWQYVYISIGTKEVCPPPLLVLCCEEGTGGDSVCAVWWVPTMVPCPMHRLFKETVSKTRYFFL